MKRNLLDNCYGRLLLCLSDELYERRQAKRFGLRFPEFFDRTQSIFVHVPKAGGTSVAMALYGRQVSHISWRMWREINPRKFDTYFKFSVIRDPVSRFISAFRFLKSGGMNAEDKEFAEKHLKLYSQPTDLANALVASRVQEQVLAWQHFQPQVDFVADDAGESKMDLLIRLDDIQAGFEVVRRRFNCQCKLPHLNKAPAPPDDRPPGLADSGVEVLKCLYQKDFGLYESTARLS